MFNKISFIERMQFQFKITHFKNDRKIYFAEIVIANLYLI